MATSTSSFDPKAFLASVGEGRSVSKVRGKGRPQPVVAKISQETLAEMIGTTRSRVSFFMNKFRRLGFIDYNGHLAVHSSLLSVVLHDDPRSVRGAEVSNVEQEVE